MIGRKEIDTDIDLSSVIHALSMLHDLHDFLQ